VAESRGLRLIESSSRDTMDYVSLITSRVSADGEERAIAGTLFGRSEPRVVRMDQYLVDFSPSGFMLVAWHIDKPGMIGRVGTLLGRRGINIAGMNVGRLQPAPGGPSVMVIALDNPAPPNVMDEIRRIDGIESVELVEL
jgi:D-3-phosphoglycerate dehydrogenase